MTRPRTTAKSAETRERILRTASRLFVEEGFRRTTMRQIAESAEVALGLTYRYFPGKEDLALALYGELAVALAARAESWKPQPLADGFRLAMEEKLRIARPHREVLSALFGATMSGEPQAQAASVAGDRSAAVRTQVRWVFRRVVERATDLPAIDEEARTDVATALYGLHLLVLLAWLVERSGGQATEGMLTAAAAVMRRATPFVASPVILPTVRQAARWIDEFLGDRPPS